MVSAAQMAALEEQLFASGLPVEALMEKAALAVVRRLQQPDWWPQLQQRGALVLVGPGHNGGDGLVVARELHLAGVAVRTWSPFERHKPLTAAHRRHAHWLGIPELSDPPDPGEGAIWIDALFGRMLRHRLDMAFADGRCLITARAQNLREVSLFPMNQQAMDLLMGSPSEATNQQLRELHLRINLPEK